MPNDEEYDIEIPLDQRLRVYGLHVDDVSREDLVVEESQELTQESAPEVHLLEPSTLLELNQWVGIENESARAVDPSELPSYRPGSFDEIESSLGAATEEGTQLVRDLEGVLGHHLFCDSRTCREWSGILEEYVRRSSLHIALTPLKTIEIKAGATLRVGNDVNVLFADLIKIENNGTLQYDGGLKVDTGVLEGVR
jgi:hypothetical protein